MTYTILGFCERTGQIGIGVATYSLVVGALCPAIAANVGVVASQAFVNPEFRTLGLGLLRQSYPAEQVLATLKGADPQIDFRQVLVLDALGRGAAHTGGRTRPWTGHKVGPHYVAAGNVLAGEKVVDAIGQAFVGSAEADLDERLLRALEAGRDAGGQVGSQGHLPERSAVLIVYGRAPHDELDLRVDMHPAAVTQIRAIREEFAPYRAFHRLRHLDPAKAPPQEIFAAELAAKARKAS